LQAAVLSISAAKLVRLMSSALGRCADVVVARGSLRWLPPDLVELEIGPALAPGPDGGFALELGLISALVDEIGSFDLLGREIEPVVV